MHIKLYIEPKDDAKNCQETIMIKGKLVVQEESELSKAWFYHIEKEKKKEKT
jgi:hypothetical protein